MQCCHRETAQMSRAEEAPIQSKKRRRKGRVSAGGGRQGAPCEENFKVAPRVGTRRALVEAMHLNVLVICGRAASSLSLEGTRHRCRLHKALHPSRKASFTLSTLVQDFLPDDGRQAGRVTKQTRTVAHEPQDRRTFESRLQLPIELSTDFHFSRKIWIEVVVAVEHVDAFAPFRGLCAESLEGFQRTRRSLPHHPVPCTPKG